MSTHERFDELCSLAVIGELSAEEATELELHLQHCAACKSAYEEYLALLNDQLPASERIGAFANAAEFPVTPQLRESTFARAATYGVRMSSEARRGPVGLDARIGDWLRLFRWSMRQQAAKLALAGLLASLLVGAAYFVRRENEHRRYEETLIAKLHSSVESSTSDTDSPNKMGLAPPDDATLRMLKGKLDQESARVQTLGKQHATDLAAMQGLQGALDRASADMATLTSKVEGADVESASLRAQLELARAAAADSESKLVAQEYRLADLAEQLKTEKLLVDKEQQLLAEGRDVRDLMGARNLHIIDVHDQDARGDARPFGRIFLTEGKRLIFYAYDLDSPLKNASFQAWGQSTDGTKSAMSLGIFYADDKKQSRWTLTVEDPNLLRAIDSVFVTVERPGGTSKPTGKKLMYAYLHNPINHP